ncbi:uncharacterized protein H6S33_001862 [Morchella sextelata]|uniref:uncharacterized protein n=1 Tax=Morchella sextelata TaxID=1174677 RepID=UPI001D05285B|nr:uncharacterized protein H6S33_001862 [Morchella sextelata]KAH0608728.1 hypothetical protein H6S33_001862 [Morchella sextelata]
MLSTAGPRRTLLHHHHHHLTRPQTRSFIFLPFWSQWPRRRPPSDAERLLVMLQRAARRRVVMEWRWEWAGPGAGWVRVQGGSSEEYDIDLITLRKVPRRAEGVVEARAETGEKGEKGAVTAGKKGEREDPGSRKEKEKERKEKEKAEKEKAEKAEKAEKERREKEKEKAEKEKAEKAEKERKEKEKEKAGKEKERAEKERKEKEKREKEKREKREKERKEKEKEEKEKAKEKESKPASKDSTPIELPVKSTTKANTSEILAKIIKGQTDKLHKMDPPTLPEKPTGRKEVATPAPEATAEATKPKSQANSVAQPTKVDDLTKVAKETPSSSPTSIKTDNITTTSTTGTIPATAVPKNEQAVAPQVKKDTPRSHSFTLVKDSKEVQESPDADIDHLLPSDIRSAAGIPVKTQPQTEAESAKAKQPTTTQADISAPPPQKKPRESPEELQERMRRIADSLDLGPIEKFIPSKDHHDHHDYEWSGTENVSTEDVLKHPSPTPTPPPATEPIPKPKPPTADPTPLIEPVVPTMPFTEPPTLPPQSPPPTLPPQSPPPPPPPTPKNYYILVRNPDTGSMHFTPLPHSLISDFPTLSRESTAFDAMRRLTNPEAFLPLWRVLQRGGFEVVGGERDCLVVMVDREGSRIKYGEVLKEVRGLVSPAERVARGAWEKRRREEKEKENVQKEVEEVKVEEKGVEEGVKEGRRPRRKIFWSAVWVAACTGAVTVGLETYL